MPPKSSLKEDAYPELRLENEPICVSLSEVNTALGELAWLESFTKTRAGVRDAQIGLAKASFERDCLVPIGTLGVMAVDREVQLRNAIADFAEEHDDILFKNVKGKTRKFANGSVGWKLTRSKIGALNPDDKTTALERLTELKSPFVEKLTQWLKSIKLIADAPLGRFVKIKAEWRKTEILKMIQDGDIKNRDLRKFGLQLLQGHDELSIEPDRYEAPMETTEAVA